MAARVPPGEPRLRPARRRPPPGVDDESRPGLPARPVARIPAPRLPFGPCARTSLLAACCLDSLATCSAPVLGPAAAARRGGASRAAPRASTASSTTSAAPARSRSSRPTFDVPNDGRRAAREASARSGTAAATASRSRRTTLAPGEEGTLKVRFRTLMMQRRVTKRIRVLHGETPRAAHPARAQAGRRRRRDPRPRPDLVRRRAPRLARPSKTVQAKWHEEAGQPFEVTSVEVPGYDFDIQTERLREGPVEGHGASRSPSRRRRRSASSRRPRCSGRTTPTTPASALPVTANVTGKVWVQSRTVYFGWVPKGAAKKTTILVKPFADGRRSRRGHGDEPQRQGRRSQVDEAPAEARRLVAAPGARSPTDAEVGKLDDVVEVRTAGPGRGGDRDRGARRGARRWPLSGRAAPEPDRGTRRARRAAKQRSAAVDRVPRRPARCPLGGARLLRAPAPEERAALLDKIPVGRRRARAPAGHRVRDPRSSSRWVALPAFHGASGALRRRPRPACGSRRSACGSCSFPVERARLAALVLPAAPLRDRRLPDPRRGRGRPPPGHPHRASRTSCRTSCRS